MDVKIKVPSLGESENEATLIAWLKSEGDAVQVDDVLAEIESDKITMEIVACEAGVLKDVSRQVDDTVEPGEVIGLIDTSVDVSIEKKAATPKSKKSKSQEEANVVAKPLAEQAKKVAKGLAKSAPESVNKAHGEDVRVVETHAKGRIEERVPMSRLRQRIASRLKEAQNTAAMLTTFNEVNMQPVMDLRARYKDGFKYKHGVGLGFMSFFVKACVHAAAKFPAINAYIDGDDIVYHNYMDIGVAVSTEKGLVVPTLRDAGLMSFAEVEQGIVNLATKARDGGLMPDDLKGGTFSITNGGVFGSLLSTPIINPPQSAILGMHTIQKRPIAENDQVVIRPMMYVALTYDHRLIDGKDAVQFLVAMKEYLEQPGMALLDV